MNTDREIGQRIRAVRKENQLSQEKMAEILGIHSTTHYQNIEYGKSKVTTNQLQILYDKFNASPNYILLGKVEGKQEYVYDFVRLPADEKIKIYLGITKSAFKVQQEYDINVRKKK